MPTVDPGYTRPLARTQADPLYDEFALAAGQTTIHRDRVVTQNAVTLTSGVLRLTYFRSKKSESYTQVRCVTGSTAAGATPTLCRVGVYEIGDDLGGTLIGSVASDTAMFAAINTEYLKTLAASMSLHTSRWYAVGLLVVTAAAAPTILGQSSFGGNIAAPSARPPRMSGALTAQTDLPSTYADASLTSYTSRAYVELVP